MPGFALLMLQAASAVTTDPNQLLLHPMPPEQCNHSGTDIVVCAKDREPYRLHDSGPQVEPTVPTKAEWRLFGDTKMSAHGEERGVPGGGGAVPEAVVTVTVPF